MKAATKRAASEALAQSLAVTAMLVIARVVFYWRCGPSLRAKRDAVRNLQQEEWIASSLRFPTTTGYFTFSKYGTSLPANDLKPAATLSPMASSMSPCAIMRKPSDVSTSRML